jgi:hypothetical protein
MGNGCQELYSKAVQLLAVRVAKGGLLNVRFRIAGRSNHLDEQANRSLLVKRNFSGAYIVQGPYHPNLTLVEHLA